MPSYITQAMLEREIEAEIAAIPDEEVREPPSTTMEELERWLLCVEDD